MADKKIKLKVIAPDKIVFDKEVDSVVAKGVNGEFGILPNHVPFMSVLSIGVTKVNYDDKVETISTVGGVFQVKDNVATIITKAAEMGSDVDVPRAKEAKERAEALLGSLPAGAEYDKAQIALLRAVTRLKAAGEI